ncbi:MAG: SMP-30/gluconolactonase/LRE family protein [Nitrospirae bacterium]|nr:SMP-30/gluconolactonase/LRE family protein [Nitrospirota bacterium]
MPDNYGLNTLFRTENPYEKRVKVASQIAENSGFAKPLIYGLMGADMASAEQWDTERNQKTEEQTKMQNFFKTFNVLSKHDAGSAVKMWNDLAPSLLKMPYKIDAVTSSPEILGVHMANDGRWWGLDKRTGGMLVSDSSTGKFIAPVQADMDALKNSLSAKEGTPEGRRILGELQDTEGIPDTTTVDNNGVSRSPRDIYTDAMKKNLAQESPSLLKQFVDERIKENKTPNEIELQARAQRGDIEARAVLDRMQSDKVKVARESRPPRTPGDSVNAIKGQILNKYLKGGTLTPQEESVAGDMIKDPYFSKAFSAIDKGLETMELPIEEKMQRAQELAAQMKKNKVRVPLSQGGTDNLPTPAPATPKGKFDWRKYLR